VRAGQSNDNAYDGANASSCTHQGKISAPRVERQITAAR
jgi:hypothetical protein